MKVVTRDYFFEGGGYRWRGTISYYPERNYLLVIFFPQANRKGEKLEGMFDTYAGRVSSPVSSFQFNGNQGFYKNDIEGYSVELTPASVRHNVPDAGKEAGEESEGTRDKC